MRVRRCRYPNCHAFAKMPNHYCSKHIEHEAEYLANRMKWARGGMNKQQQHKYNTVTRYRNDAKQEQYSFYHSRQWVALRQEVLERDHYICQYCGAINSKTADHIIPIEFDSKGKADITNLAVICRKCHRLKTDWEQSYYGTGQHNELKHVEPIKDIGKIKELMNR